MILRLRRRKATTLLVLTLLTAAVQLAYWRHLLVVYYEAIMM